MPLARRTLACALTAALLPGCTAGDTRPGGAPTGAGGSAPAARCGSAPVRIAGSPMQGAAMAAWMRGYRTACPQAVVQVVRPTPAGTDAVLAGEADLAGAQLPPAPEAGPAARGCRPVGLPVLAAPVTIVHSLPGVPSLTVTPAVLARVYLGQVTEWSDPELAAANPGVSLPAARLTVLRAYPATAGSEVVSRFLAARVPDLWTARSGSGWPAVPSGDAVADVLAEVRHAQGALGYVEGRPAREPGVAVASLDAGSGGVAPTAAAVRSAVEAADVGGDPPDVRVTVDPGAERAGAYPLVLVGYQVTCLAAGDPRAASVEAFLAYATGPDGQAVLERLGYAPLPDGLRGRVRAAVDSLSPD